AEFVRGTKDLIEHGLRAALEMDNLAAPIVRRFFALDPTIGFEAVEQAGKGRLFNAHVLGDFLLREAIAAAREMHKSAPLALAQTEGTEALVERRAPGTRGAEKHETKFINGGRRHGATGNSLAR